MYHVVDEAGKDDAKGRIAHGTPDGFGNLVKCFPDCRVAFDASMNCRWLCEILELQMPAEDSGLANPYKTRLIDEAQIKTDWVDARILAQLLRADLIRRVHIPCLEKLTLPAPSGLLLKQQLELLRSVQQCIEEDEAALAEMMENSQGLEQVLSVPGIGPIIAAVIMSEVDDIGRFPSTKSSALTRASARRRAS